MKIWMSRNRVHDLEDAFDWSTVVDVQFEINQP